MVEQLLSVGSAGGYVTGVSGTDQEPVIAAMYPDPDTL